MRERSDKLCECGCGEFTLISNDTKKIKLGKPNRFIVGHYIRGKNHPMWNGGISYAKNHVLIRVPKGHPNVSKRGYVRRSHLVVEKALGKYLPPKSIVHHADLDPTNDTPGNLVLCEDAGYHSFLHRRQRALDACGNVHCRKCYICKQYDIAENLYIGTYGSSICHRACEKEHSRKKRLAKKQKGK